MKSFPHTCSHCGQVDVIMRAVAVSCPTCPARSGKPCLDMRGKTPGVVPIVKLHPTREDRIRDLDQTRVAWARKVQDHTRRQYTGQLIPFPHTCTSCGYPDMISRALVAQCPTCHVQPGEPCLSLSGPKQLTNLHPARGDRIRELDLQLTRPALRAVPDQVDVTTATG